MRRLPTFSRTRAAFFALAVFAFGSAAGAFLVADTPVAGAACVPQTAAVPTGGQTSISTTLNGTTSLSLLTVPPTGYVWVLHAFVCEEAGTKLDYLYAGSVLVATCETQNNTVELNDQVDKSSLTVNSSATNTNIISVWYDKVPATWVNDLSSDCQNTAVEGPATPVFTGAVVDGSGTFVTSTLVPIMVGLLVAVLLVALTFKWFARHSGRVT